MAYFISKKVLQGATGSELIPLLGSTGKLQLLFAITFAIALAL
jgi:1,4-dihydroxy-2-naphthoate octaprenyltransferase